MTVDHIPSSQFSLLWCKENPILITMKKAMLYIIYVIIYVVANTKSSLLGSQKENFWRMWLLFSFDCNDKEYIFQASKGYQSPIKVVPMICALCSSVFRGLKIWDIPHKSYEPHLWYFKKGTEVLVLVLVTCTVSKCLLLCSKEKESYRFGITAWTRWAWENMSKQHE